MYGKMYCEMWHRPLSGNCLHRAAVNKQIERNRCFIGKPRALISNLPSFFSVYGSKMALFEPRKKFGATGPLVIAGYREVTE